MFKLYDLKYAFVVIVGTFGGGAERTMKWESGGGLMIVGLWYPCFDDLVLLFLTQFGTLGE